MIKLAFVFRHSPHGSSVGREGLDALLAATAFCDENDIAVFFMDDGVFNLLSNQQPELLLQKDFISGLKLLDLYDIKRRYVCRRSLQRFGLEHQPQIIQCEPVDPEVLWSKLREAEKCLVF